MKKSFKNEGEIKTLSDKWKLIEFLTNRSSRNIQLQQKENNTGSSLHGSAEVNLTSIHKDAGSIPALAQWVRERCCELWCRSQMQLRCGIAVAVAQASCYIFIQHLAWEPPYAAGAALKTKKKKKKRTQVRTPIYSKEYRARELVNMHDFHFKIPLQGS